MQLAGVHALTIPPNLLQSLSDTEEPEAKLAAQSMFKRDKDAEEQQMERMSFIDDENKYREKFTKSDGGNGERKTRQV